MKRTRYRKESLVLFLLLVALCAITSQAQSGRRQPKPPPAAPVPTPTPEPTPQPKTTQEKEPELGFIIGADSFNVDAFPIAYYDLVAHACAERLSSGSSAAVDVARNGMNRGEAVKKAKGETKTHVIWLNLKLDPLVARSDDDLEIEFWLFAPQTAKVVTSGTAYMGGVRKGPVVVGPTSRTRGGPMYREQMLKRAGEEVADRILKAMNLNVPVVR